MDTTSPYTAPVAEDAEDVRIPGADKPKIKDEGVPSPGDLKAYVDTITNMTDRVEAAVAAGVSNGTVKVTEMEPEGAPSTPEQVLAKVLVFLDNKMRGPITLLGPLRHKYFVMKIPTQQELIEASALAGTQIVSDPTEQKKMLVSDQTWNLVGELQKSCLGYIMEKSPNLSLLKQNIGDPTKWPPLRETNWLATTDPYALQGEVYPLWSLYEAWRARVVPTVDEFDFYWANQE